MALKLRRKRKQLGHAAVLLAVMVLAACDTQPATDVTSNAATLNAKGFCGDGSYGGTNQYQIRNSLTNGGFFDVGPRYRFDCRGATGEVALNSYRVGGLAPGNAYQFRLVSRLDNGAVQTWDANGTNGGTAYDGFWTYYTPEQMARQADGGESEFGPDPAELSGPCADGVTACASSSRVKSKAGLTNIHNQKHYACPVCLPKATFWWAKVVTSWNYVPAQYKVVARNSVPSADTTNIGDKFSFGIKTQMWVYSACHNNNSNCLTRRQVTGGCCLGHVWVATNTVCIGTRIFGDGSHNRNIEHRSCPGIEAASAQPSSQRTPDLVDLVDDDTADQVREDCDAEVKGTRAHMGPKCRSIVNDVLRQLSAKQRKLIKAPDHARGSS